MIVAVMVVVLDQITKAMVRPALALHESREVIPGFLDLTRVHNTGAAFGMLNAWTFRSRRSCCRSWRQSRSAASHGRCDGAARRPAGAGRHRRRAGRGDRQSDRSRDRGYVLDFVDAYWNGWHFWAFNVADAAITVGVIFMILDILGLGRRRASNTV